MLTKSLSRVSSLLVIATLSACGAETKSNSEATPDYPAEKAAEAIEPVAKAPDTATPPSEAPRAVSDAPSAYPQALYLADAGSRPVCAAANEGQLVYLVGAKEFQACAAGQWQVVDLRGPQGLKGDAGEAGAAGANGQDNRIIAAVSCSRVTANPLLVQYNVSLMASGDVFVRCGVTNDGREHSASMFHASGSQGASDLSCSVGYDLGAANFGYFSFKTDLGVRSFTSHDDTDTTVNFAAEECTTAVY